MVHHKVVIGIFLEIGMEVGSRKSLKSPKATGCNWVLALMARFGRASVWTCQDYGHESIHVFRLESLAVWPAITTSDFGLVFEKEG